MDLIEQTIKSFLADYAINNPERIYLVAFSGGYDSMCLLNCLKNICSNKIIAIHLNHNWRGEESDIEEINCKNFCKNIAVEFYSEKLPDFIEKNETSARDERYNFFSKCAKKFNSKIIFTAHNKNDNVETILYRIAKGCGTKGLCGIAPNRDLYYRPLLNIERSEIEKYCKINNLAPNNDSSNKDLIHKRNLIRQNILPLLEEINPKILNGIARLITNANDDNQIINEYITNTKTQIVYDNKYSTKDFLTLSKPLQLRLIYELISPFVIQNYDRERFLNVLEFIEQNKKSKSGKTCSITTNIDLFINSDYFTIIQPKEKCLDSIIIKKAGKYEFNNKLVTIEPYKNIKTEQRDSNYILADLSGINFEFELRTRQDGDFIQPLGINGHQKLKKYLNTRKIPNYIKDDLILLTSGKEVLWVVGVGLSDKIKVTKEPTHIIKIEDL